LGYDEGTAFEGTSRYYFEKLKGLVTGSKTKVLETSTFLTSTNYYDDRYRVIQTLRDLFSTTTTDNEVASVRYDFPGKVMKTQTKQVFLGNTNTVTETSSYDHAGRLKQVKHQVNSGTEVTLASMEYDEIGQLKQKSLNGEVGSGIQNLNYAYNIRGWLEKINNPDVNPSATSTQKLNLGLYYNNVPSGLSANSQFNGNIAGLVWNVTAQAGTLFTGTKEGYGFTYDGLNRMTNSAYGEGSTFATNMGANNENLTYDKNGNILTLTRYLKGTGLIDNLSYTYKSGGASNMLDRVDDAVAGDYGFTEYVKQANEYTFDGNGNLTSDANKGYNSIQYNYLNLPKRVGTTEQFITYIYDATGTKLAKVGTGGTYTYYTGSFVYSGSSLKYIMHREGMYLPGGNYQYYLKDHLGNTRLVVNTSGTGGTVVQQTDYYPFGMDIATYNGGIDNKYRYNSKEFQDDMINGKRLEWYDYGARFYDPQIGRWHTIDPKAETYLAISPYTFVANNPIMFLDPNGMEIIMGGGQYGGDLFTGADAQRLFSIFKNKGSANVYIGPKKYADNINSNKNNTNWFGFHSDEIEQANDLLHYLAGNLGVGISNVYLQTHGGGSDLLIVPKGDDCPDMTNIDANYASNEFFPITTMSLENGYHKKETDALFGMMALISKNGNFILGACLSANNTEGKNGTFLESLYKMNSNKNIDIYGCIDPNSTSEKVLDRGMPGTQYMSQGWGYCGTSTGGKFVKVTQTSPSYTGRLVLNSNGRPFSFEKK